MKKITVSVGISAYNEEANIGWMLGSLLIQKEISFTLKEILILSDGSSDKTVEIIKLFKDSRIKVVDSPKRLGKPSRLNQIFRKFNADYLLITDADVKFKNPFVIEKLVKRIIRQQDLSLVMAKVFPYIGTTILEKAIYNFFIARDSVKNGYDYTKTVYAARGAGMLLSKNFAKSLTLPADILNDDAYIYLKARSQNLAIGFVRNAVILYRSVNNISEYRRQFKRYLDGEKQFKDYFNPELLSSEYRAPGKLLLRIMFKQIRINLFAYILLRLINSYCQYDLKFRKQSTHVKWSIASSSKTLMLGQIIKKVEGEYFA